MYNDMFVWVYFSCFKQPKQPNKRHVYSYYLVIQIYIYGIFKFQINEPIHYISNDNECSKNKKQKSRSKSCSQICVMRFGD